MPEILRVRTRTLEIGYEAHGDVGGVPVILLHGFPDDARAWDDVAPPPATAGAERAYWYQWYFNTERGRMGLERNRREICRLLWQEWSPGWRFDDATFDRTAASFDNPDFVPVVIHSYRVRHGNAPSDPRFGEIERRLSARPPISVPTMILHGAEDTVGPPGRSEGELSRFPAGTERRVVPGVGHFMPREDPEAVVDALLKVLH